MKNKVVSVVLVAGMLIGALTGCGQSSDVSAKGAEVTQDVDETVVATEAKTEEQEVKTIVCGTTTGYYPFVYTDDNDKLIGYDIDLIKAVFDRLPQYELKFELNEWDAILTGLDSGLYQISTECIFYSEERAEKYYFSDPIFYDPVVAVTPADYKDVSTFEDIAGETTPASPGSIWALAVEKYNEDHPDKMVNIDYAEADFFQLFGKAEAGDEILLTDYGMATGIQAANDFNVRIQQLDSDFLNDYMNSSYTFFMMSRYGEESAQLQKDVNQALAEVLADGTATALSEHYFGEDLTTVKHPVQE